MNRNILVFVYVLLFEQTILLSTVRERFYLPMKKSHKYGDDICYYRNEIDEKHDYAIYYVKPCEKGKYCESEISDQPLGFCRDILTKAIDFPTYEGECNSNGECQSGLNCDGGKCKKSCSSSRFAFYEDLNSIECEPDNTKTNTEGKYCKSYEAKFNNVDPKYYYQGEVTIGKYPGLPKECGIIRYKSITDVDQAGVTTSSGTTYKPFTRWIKESEEWCTIGEAEDGDFVTDSRFCKSGFTLLFYPNGDLIDPSNSVAGYNEQLIKMCVTPIQIDKSNPVVGTIVIYKIKEGNEQKYNYFKYYNQYIPVDENDLTQGYRRVDLDETIVIKSQLYTQFVEEFKNASDEDKINCYRIPEGIEGNCENIKLLKLYYFYNHIKEYLFYKDRKDLEKVLHYKIQKVYNRYYENSTDLNIKYLLLLIILILL